MLNPMVAGSVVADFEKLLHYIISEEGILVGGQHSLFNMQTLPALNALLTHPIKHDLQRPVQKNFPHLYALNILLRFSGLARIVHTKKKSILRVDQKTFHSWNSLTHEEKYWNLLPIVFLQEISEAIDDNMRCLNCVYHLSWLLQHGIKGKKFESYKDQRVFSYRLPTLALGFFDLFGFLSIERAEPEAGCGWRFTSIHSTSFGVAIAKLLIEKSKMLQLEYSNESITEMRSLFQTKLSSHISSWKCNLIVHPPSTISTDIHVFKVSLCKSWKTIAVHAKETLADFAHTILKAFSFDSDHLYYFSYKDWRGIPVKIYHDYVSDADHFVNEYTIASLCLSLEQPMTFLFDFGDNWEFQLQLKELVPLNLKQTISLKSGGDLVPEQYICYDD